jgi:hypothetical protein
MPPRFLYASVSVYIFLIIIFLISLLILIFIKSLNTTWMIVLVSLCVLSGSLLLYCIYKLFIDKGTPYTYIKN